MKRPLIIAPAAERADEEGVKFLANQAYADAIDGAGGIFLAVGRPQEETAIAQIVDMAHGLFLLGGRDVCPSNYNEEDRHCRGIDKARDTIELELLRRFLRARKPILGICRGMQAMNIVAGGSLYQDVLHEMPGAVRHDFHTDESGKALARKTIAHNVTIVPGTLLHRIVGMTDVRVNSLHHQGVRGLGNGLRMSAHAPDTLPEALEVINHPFAVGVQWHPEELGDDTSRRLFSAFVDAASVATQMVSTSDSGVRVLN